MVCAEILTFGLLNFFAIFAVLLAPVTYQFFSFGIVFKVDLLLGLVGSGFLDKLFRSGAKGWLKLPSLSFTLILLFSEHSLIEILINGGVMTLGSFPLEFGYLPAAGINLGDEL